MIKEINDIEIVNTFLKEFNTSINDIGVFNHYNVYTIDDEIVGFISYDLIYDRVEIEYIFVKENFQRKGIASSLLNNLLDIATKNNCKNITLEVRESNIKAIELYKKHLFKEVARRSNYYNDEDGILMIRELV